jgi:hypothetical protein
MRPTCLLVCLFVSACALPRAVADERAAVYADEARYDSLSALPYDSLAPGERTERDRLASGTLERQQRLEALSAREERHRREVLLGIGAVVLAAGGIAGYVLLVSAD